MRGGGEVVKNAAGFYLHHLLLGSLGRLGVMTELTFKVFPAPPAQLTRRRRTSAVRRARSTRWSRCGGRRSSSSRSRSMPPATLLVRLGGSRGARGARRGPGDVPARRARARAAAGGGRRAVARTRGLRVAATDARAPLAKRSRSRRRDDRAARRLAAARAAARAPARRAATASAGKWRGSAGRGALDRPRRLLRELGLSGVVLDRATARDPLLGVRPDRRFSPACADARSATSSAAGFA